MKASYVWAGTFLFVAGVGLAVTSTAQQPTASSTPTPSTDKKDLQLPTPKQMTHEELRFQFIPHVFGVNDVLQEIYIKLDAYTGKTWRFHASSSQWTPIPEPNTANQAREASEQNRYELLTHDYYDTYGEEHELILRVDGVSGNSWTYRGANGAWKEVTQVD